MEKLKKRVRIAEKQVQKLTAKIQELTTKQGKCLDSDLHNDLLGIMNESSENVRKAYPDGSFARLFWEEQLNAASVSDSKQVHWHPLLI